MINHSKFKKTNFIKLIKMVFMSMQKRKILKTLKMVLNMLLDIVVELPSVKIEF